MNLPHIAIIILNWNGSEDTIECLESVYQIDYPNYNVIVVDNASEDNSIEQIKNYCEGKIKVNSRFFDYNQKNKPITIFEYDEKNFHSFTDDKTKFENLPQDKRVILINNLDNKGYTGGNNVGMQFVLKYLISDYVVILNNDVVVDPAFLNELVIAALKNPTIGILGPSSLSYDEPNKVYSMGAKMNYWTGGWKALEAGISSSEIKMDNIEVDFVGGAAMMIKKEVIEKIGFFYSPYFAYWEETDYCIQAKNNGFKVICTPRSKIWHKVSSSISITSPTRIYLILRNNIIFMRRNAKIRHFPSFILFYLILRVPSFIIWGFYQSSIKNSLTLIYISIKALLDGITFNFKRV
ncbi:glycosyltransferase family 2 protein [Methanobacterium sp.]|uniref:glycosyltransferase family 2 protein n=1 Tax=Methanobacterium sp. TaxID=2164 RepID=UPI003C73C659